MNSHGNKNFFSALKIYLESLIWSLVNELKLFTLECDKYEENATYVIKKRGLKFTPSNQHSNISMSFHEFVNTDNPPLASVSTQESHETGSVQRNFPPILHSPMF